MNRDNEHSVEECCPHQIEAGDQANDDPRLLLVVLGRVDVVQGHADGVALW